MAVATLPRYTAPMAKLLPYVKVGYPYAAALALVALVLTGKLSTELAGFIALALGLPSPLQSLISKLGPGAASQSGKPGEGSGVTEESQR